MGGFGLRKGEALRIQKMRDAGLTTSEIMRQTKRSAGFVDKVIATAPTRVTASPGLPASVSMPAANRALAELVLGLDIPKEQKLRVLEALL